MNGAAHCGQVFNCGSVSLLLEARRMRCLLFDGLRLGTGISQITISIDSIGPKAMKNRHRLTYLQTLLSLWVVAPGSLLGTTDVAEKRATYLRGYRASSPRKP